MTEIEELRNRIQVLEAHLSIFEWMVDRADKEVEILRSTHNKELKKIIKVVTNVYKEKFESWKKEQQNAQDVEENIQ